jgi:hypothetical protein
MKSKYSFHSLCLALTASMLVFGFQTAQAQFIGGVGAAPEAAGATAEAVGAGALGSNLGAIAEFVALGSTAGAGAGAAVGAGVATGAAIGGLSTTAAIALGAVAVGAAAVALTNQGTTGTK